MKFVVAALALVAIATPLNAWKAPPAGSGALAKELDDFVALIPLKKVVGVVKAHIARDKQVQDVLKIAASAESAAYIKELEAVPEFKQLANYIQKAGLDINLLLNHLNKALNIAPINPMETYKPVGGKGVAGLDKDLMAVIPLRELYELWVEKWENSPVIKDLVKEVLSVNDKLTEATLNSVHVANLLKAAKDVGVSDKDFLPAYSILLIAHVVRSNH